MSALLFYFIRHGETDWNVERRLQGSRDIPLNGRGRRQAAQCGDTLRNLIEAGGRMPADFTYVSSPLSRATETMEIMRGALGLSAAGYATDPRLAELSFGRWEGKTYKEIGAANPAALKLRDRDRWNHRPPDGESYADLMVRLRAWYDGVTGNVVVTAHGGVARAAMVMLGIRTTAEVPLGDIEQGVVFEFSPGAMKKHY